MTKIIKSRSVKTGLAPGTPVHIGETICQERKISVLRYDENHFTEEIMTDHPMDFKPSQDKKQITWVMVEGIPDIQTLEHIGHSFGLHPLILEDILNTDHRPKKEDYGEYIYLVLKTLSFDEDRQEIDTEQVSILLGSNYVISFQEKRDTLFGPIKDRIRNEKGRIRTMKSDYLAYSLLDIIIDHYFAVLEKFADMTDDLEELFIINPSQSTLKTFHKLKKEMLFLRKSVWPLREVLGGLERGDSKLITPSTDLYLRDVYDHVTQIIDIIETLRDMLSEMLDIYLSGVSNRINDVMKVLTIITTIFIPLSFIAGVYGMNFKYMPELNWRWGYPATLVLMASIGFFMVLYFKRKRWMYLPTTNY